jgi:hypothetical protein
MSIPKMTNDLAVIQKLSDLPNSTEGLTAEQLKAKFDEASLEIQRYINEKLIPAIVAAQIPFTATSEINAQNVDAAIREVQKQVKDASSGTIVNGSVTTEKLSAALLSRVYGGRPWVSLNTPGSAQNTAADFPIGQIWLRPAFTVVNAATKNWVANGCTVATEENKITVTGNNTVTTATITQAVTGIGQDGDRVMVLFDIQNKDSDITNLTVSLNSGEEQDVSAGVFESTLVGGSLTVQIAATWPSTSLAGGSFDVVNYTVVNLDQVLRQTTNAEDMTDWAGFLSGLLPLSSYTSKEEAFIQSINGNWWPLSYSVQPVSRGGTGNGTVAYGEMLYGTGNETMERLGAAAEDNSFLMFSGGKPVWAGAGDATVNTNILRVATGSYTGNGSNKSVSLPVTPKMLHISTPSGFKFDSNSFASDAPIDRPVTLGQSGSDAARYSYSVEGGYAYSISSVALSGKTLSMAGPYLCNRSCITYNWVAIY